MAFTCILSAITLHPQFSWIDNALSDLGIVKGTTAILFNSGLIISGVLALIFGSGLFFLLRKTMLGKAGTLMFIFGALALVAMGIFPEDAKPMHYYASVSFFALFPISTLLVAATFILAHEVKTGLFTFSVAMFAAVVWILQFSTHFVHGVAIPETLSSLSGSAWAIVFGLKMSRKKSQPTSGQS